MDDENFGTSVDEHRRCFFLLARATLAAHVAEVPVARRGPGAFAATAKCSGTRSRFFVSDRADRASRLQWPLILPGAAQYRVLPPDDKLMHLDVASTASGPASSIPSSLELGTALDEVYDLLLDQNGHMLLDDLYAAALSSVDHVYAAIIKWADLGIISTRELEGGAYLISLKEGLVGDGGDRV